MNQDSRGFLQALLGDGRPLIAFSAICLGLAGSFAILQSVSRHFLPHDVAYLQMSPEDLCAINECRIVHFMFHDRVSFGGVLIAIAVLYLWLTEFPLRAGQAWAWWTLVASAIAGFGSFLTYLGYGYLDTWHGVATLFLLPCFTVGLWKTRALVKAAAGRDAAQPAWGGSGATWTWKSRAGVGRACLLLAAAGTLGAGATIQTVGMTSVFVPSDLTFMGLSAADLDAINPRLIPLIAHDRAGFGGGLATVGLLGLCSIWFAAPSRSLWQALLLAGIAGWTTAIGIHPIIGYTDAVHLAPAVAGAVLFFIGLALTGPYLIPAREQ